MAFIVGAALLAAAPARALNLYTNGPPTYPSPGTGCSEMGIATDYWIAYRFTPTTSGTANSLAFFSSVCCGFNPNGIVELRNDGAGIPGTTILGSGTFTAPSSTGLVTVSIGNVNVSTGTNYWVVMRPNGSGSPALGWSYQSSAAGSFVKRSANGGASWTDFYVGACGTTKTPSLQVIGTVTNVAPSVSNFSSTGLEDSNLLFSSTDFTSHFSDGNGDALARIEISTLPANGQLWVNSAQISTVPYQVVTANLGGLRFVPTANWNGSTSFTWKGQDGALWSSAAATATLNVGAVNDAPAFTAGGPSLSVNEDSGAYSQAWATGVSMGPANEASQVGTFTITNSNPSLFSVAPAISATGTLSFTPAANASGVAVLSVVKLQDNGGTANGGVDQVSASGPVIVVAPVNDKPSFSVAGDVTVAEDSGAKVVSNQALNVVAGPGDESTQAVTFQVSSNNPGLFAVAPAIDVTGTLSFTPAANASGDALVTVVARDNGGTVAGGVDTSDARTFTIHVTAVNDAPSFTAGTNPTVLEDSGAQSLAWATGISAGTNESQALTFVIQSNSNSALFSTQPAISAAGTLTFTPAANASGSATLAVVLKDDGGTANGGSDTSAVRSLTITVTPVNDAPVLALVGDKTVAEGGHLSVTLSATDIDSGTLTYSAENLPAGATFDSATRTLDWTPGFTAAGTYPGVVLKVSDGQQTDSQTIAITVTNTNRPPVFDVLADQTVAEGALLTFVVHAVDPDGDALTYSASNLPAGATFDAPTATFAWTPSFSQAGSFPGVTFTAADGKATATLSVGITVGETARGPVFDAIAEQSVNEGAPLTFTVHAVDPDGGATLTYSATNLPAGATFDPATAVFSWTPGFDQAGVYSDVRFVAAKGAQTATATVKITVANVNRPPVLAALGDQTVAEGAALTFVVQGSDVDGDPLSYSATNLPSGAAFDAAKATFTWTPAFSQSGSYPGVRFSVSDGAASAERSVTITVSNTPRAPVFDGLSNQTVQEGSRLTFTVHATDPDGSATLTYSASGLPSGATFSAATATFDWTPAAGTAGVYSNVKFVAANGALTATLEISITVLHTNRAPSAFPLTVDVPMDTATDFTLMGLDPDGDSLSFSVVSDPQNGSLSGTAPSMNYRPKAGFVGTDTMQFKVSDSHLESLAATVEFAVFGPDAGGADAGGEGADASEVDASEPSDAGIQEPTDAEAPDASSVDAGLVAADAEAPVVADGSVALADGSTAALPDAGTVQVEPAGCGCGLGGGPSGLALLIAGLLLRVTTRRRR